MRHDCVHIYQYIMEFDDDPNSVSAVWACPDEQDEGLCINTIVDHLVQINNRFISESGNADATAPIMNSDMWYLCCFLCYSQWLKDKIG